MQIYKMEQQSDDWFAIRKGKLTGSHAQAIGNCGRGLDTYIIELMSEYFSSGEKESYTNADIERGIELEATAREIYELDKACDIEQIGFIEYNDYVGCSPDGLIGKDGGIEIKALKDTNHFKMILNGEREIDSKYLWQIQMNLFITGRKWWDYVSYNPNFEKSLLVFRIEPDEKKFKKLEEGIEIGTKKIKQIISNIKK